MLIRRDILLGTVAALAAAAAIGGRRMGKARAATETFEVNHTPEEWKKLLTQEQYAVLREQDTERPFTSPLNREKRHGIFACAGIAKSKGFDAQQNAVVKANIAFTPIGDLVEFTT